MPCSVCGTEGHNARSCSKRVDGPKKAEKPTLPAPPKPAAVARPRKVVRKSPRTVDVDELLARRESLLSDLDEVNEQIACAIEDQQAKLDRMKQAVSDATRRAAEAA